ncbi:MAG: hypothetical protein JSW28_01960, partial [Thermoplasmata archaeon]
MKRKMSSIFLCVVTISAVFAIIVPTNVIAVCGCGSGALPGVAAYWKFEEGSGTIAYDSTDNHNDGTLGGATDWTTGQVGSALHFIPKPPGPGSWVKVDDDPSLNPS